MLVTLWSPKGGTGTSVAAAALASVLARHHRHVRLVDLCGDQPAICASRCHGERGAADWLLAGPTTPASAIDAFTVDDVGRFALVPSGTADVHDARDEAGAALAVVLRDSPWVSVVDAGLASAPAVVPLVELADLSLIVVRPCFLALTRAARREALVRATSGVLMIDEPHRALGARDIAAIIELPVLGTVAYSPEVARAIDAGVVLRRAPEALFRPLGAMVDRLGLGGGSRRVA